MASASYTPTAEAIIPRASDKAPPDHDPADVPAMPVENRGLLMVAVMGASIVQFLDATIANVALPHMQTSLGATFDTVTWVLTSFIIASAVATPITGWLADQIGSRRLFLIAVSGFMITSMLCGIAVNLTEMVIFRIFQGIFAAFIGPLSQTIMLDINPPSRHARAMAIWGMGVMIAPISGPMIGGWLTESYSWRWVFYINVPIGIATLAVLWILLPSRAIVRRRLDYIGYGLFAIGLGVLQLMLDRGQGEDWLQSPEIVIELIIAVACLWMFGVHVATAKNPIFPRALLTDRTFVTAMGFMALMGVVLISISALMPPMLQNLFGYPVLDTGILLAPRGVGVLISMMIATRLIAAVGPRVLVAVGFTIASLSLFHMSGWSLEVDRNEFLLLGFLQGLGMGLCFMPMNVIAFASVAPQHRTDAAGLANLSRSIGGSAGISLITTLFARNVQISHSDLTAHVTPFNLPAVDLSSVDRLGEVGQAGLAAIDGMINQQAAMIAYVDVFWLLAIMIGAFVPMTLLMRSPKPGAPPPPMIE